jgi:hypothetical protein
MFEFQFWPDRSILAPTEFYVPDVQYPDGYRVQATGGDCQADDEHQRLTYVPHTNHKAHTVRIEPAGPPRTGIPG